MEYLYKINIKNRTSITFCHHYESSGVMVESRSCMKSCDTSAQITSNCKDSHPFCPQLHSKCETEQPVRSSCQKTCNTCVVEESHPECFDKNTDICQNMADCSREEYQLMCPRKCKSCDKISRLTAAEEAAPLCDNLSAACEDPAVKKQCPSNLWIRLVK